MAFTFPLEQCHSSTCGVGPVNVPLDAGPRVPEKSPGSFRPPQNREGGCKPVPLLVQPCTGPACGEAASAAGLPWLQHSRVPSAWT